MNFNRQTSYVFSFFLVEWNHLKDFCGIVQFDWISNRKHAAAAMAEQNIDQGRVRLPLEFLKPIQFLPAALAKEAEELLQLIRGLSSNLTCEQPISMSGQILVLADRT
jgi:hypothetical protein